MFKASSLLLLTLVLNVQLCLSAPTPAKVLQTCVVAEEPGQLALVTEDQSHLTKEKESVQRKRIPVIAGETVPSPEESPAEEDVFIGDQVSDDEADEAVSWDSREPLASTPQVSLEEETVPVEDAFAEAPLAETTEDNVPTVAVENESPDDHYVEDQATGALIPVMSLEDSEEEAPEEIAEEEIAVENTSPEQHDLENKAVPVEPAELELDQEEQGETVPIISAEEEEAVAPVVLKENTEVDPTTKGERLPRTLQEEEPFALFPIELETEKEDQVEQAAQESAPEDPVVIDPLNPTEEEESISIVSPEYTENEAAGVPVPIVRNNHEQDPAINEEPLPRTPEEEESVVYTELDTEEERQEEATAEETVPEKPVDIVLVEPTSEEPDPEVPIIIVPPEDLEEDAPDNTEKEVVQSDPKDAVLEADPAPQENEAGDSDAEILVTSVTGTTSHAKTIETAIDTSENVPVAATEVHAATTEPVTTPAPAVDDAEPMATHGEDFVELTEDEPVALVNRGVVLGAAFFTLMSFISLGFIWTTIFKKLH